MYHCPRYECKLVRTNTVKYDHTSKKVTSSSAATKIIPEIVAFDLQNSPNEKFVIVCLDTKNQPIGTIRITEGTLDASLCHPREVFRPAIILNAASVVLCHNHPSGDLTPSREDILVTKRMQEVGTIIGISVLDHIIVGTNEDGEFVGVSLADLGAI